MVLIFKITSDTRTAAAPFRVALYVIIPVYIIDMASLRTVCVDLGTVRVSNIRVFQHYCMTLDSLDVMCMSFKYL